MAAAFRLARMSCERDPHPGRGRLSPASRQSLLPPRRRTQCGETTQASLSESRRTNEIRMPWVERRLATTDCSGSPTQDRRTIGDIRSWVNFVVRLLTIERPLSLPVARSRHSAHGQSLSICAHSFHSLEDRRTFEADVEAKHETMAAPARPGGIISKSLDADRLLTRRRAAKAPAESLLRCIKLG
jgi:hypothetical protein